MWTLGAYPMKLAPHGWPIPKGGESLLSKWTPPLYLLLSCAVIVLFIQINRHPLTSIAPLHPINSALENCISLSGSPALVHLWRIPFFTGRWSIIFADSTLTFLTGFCVPFTLRSCSPCQRENNVYACDLLSLLGVNIFPCLGSWPFPGAIGARGLVLRIVDGGGGSSRSRLVYLHSGWADELDDAVCHPSPQKICYLCCY